MKKFAKATGVILYGATVLAVVLVAGALLATMVPIPGNIEVKIVKSGSMEPSIMTGSVVVIKPTETYGVGDVITFGKDTKREIPTTHRIVEVITNANGTLSYRTKGDANEEADQSITSAKEVIGKVLVSVPNVGFVLDFARTRNGFLAMIVVPALMVIFDEGLTIAGEVKKMRRRKEAPVTLEPVPLLKPKVSTREIQTAFTMPPDIIRKEHAPKQPTRIPPRQIRMVDITPYRVVLR